MISRFSDFSQKEVINASDGKRLGYVQDLSIDWNCNKILSIIVPGPCRFFGLIPGDTEYVIPWACIRRIGEDVILVDVVPGNVKKAKSKNW